MDWTNPETIDTAFYTMKGLEDLAKAVPVESRPAMLASLASHFSLPAAANTEDQSVKRIFVFSRMKLDTLPNQEESRAFFLQSVQTALGILQDTIDHEDFSTAASDEPNLFSMPVQSAEVVAPPRTESESAPSGAENKSDHSSAVGSGTIFRHPDDQPPAWISGMAPDGRPEDLATGFTSLLLPHPRVDGLKDMSSWISGKPWAPGEIAISFPETASNVERFVEEEAEMSQGMALYLKRVGCMELAEPSSIYRDWNPQGHAAWLLAQGGGPVRVDALNYFAWAIGDAYAVFSDDKAIALHQHGATLKFGVDAARMVTNLANLEQEFLANYDAEQEAALPEASVLGAANPNYQLTPGHTLRRAAFMHVAMGADLGDCLVEALAEFRLALVQRELAEEYDQSVADAAPICFNEVFFSDCKSEAEAYRLAKNVVRLSFGVN